MSIHHRHLVYLTTVTGIAVFLLTAGCSANNVKSRPDLPVESSRAAEATKPFKEDNPLKMQVEVVPSPARILKDTLFRVTLHDAKGKPVENASVIIAFSMPGMDHGDLQFRAEQKGEGVYVGKGIPVMVGSWVADVRVEINGHTTSATYTFQAIR